MRILIDAMGGDNAPREIVRGAVDAVKEFNVDVSLVGREDEILPILKEWGVDAPTDHISVVNAREVVEMEDDPSSATRRKPDSSMAVALRLLHEGAAVILDGDVGLYAEDPRRVLRNACRKLLHLLERPCGHHDIGAEAAEKACRGEPDARTRPGHDNYFILEIAPVTH